MRKLALLMSLVFVLGLASAAFATVTDVDVDMFYGAAPLRPGYSQPSLDVQLSATSDDMTITSIDIASAHKAALGVDFKGVNWDWAGGGITNVTSRDVRVSFDVMLLQAGITSPDHTFRGALLVSRDIDGTERVRSFDITVEVEPIVKLVIGNTAVTQIDFGAVERSNLAETSREVRAINNHLTDRVTASAVLSGDYFVFTGGSVDILPDASVNVTVRPKTDLLGAASPGRSYENTLRFSGTTSGDVQVAQDVPVRIRVLGDEREFSGTSGCDMTTIAPLAVLALLGMAAFRKRG